MYDGFLYGNLEEVGVTYLIGQQEWLAFENRLDSQVSHNLRKGNSHR